MARARRRRFGGYFASPRFGKGQGKRGVRTEHVLITLFGLFIGVIVYSQFILPALDDLRCGADYVDQLALWQEVGGHGPAPVCESELPDVLRNLHTVLPLIFLAPLAMLIFRQTGAPTIAPTMVMTWVMVWLVPSPLIDMAIAVIGLAACCMPYVVRGPLAAFSHAVALVLWPAFALMVVQVATKHELPAGLPWALDLAAFLILPAVLIAVPIIGLRR